MQSFRIEKPKPKDIKEIVKLSKLAEKEVKGWTKYSYSDLKRLYLNDKDNLLVAKSENEIVGFIVGWGWVNVINSKKLKEWRKKVGRKVMQIDGLYIKKNYRHRRIASSLLKKYISVWKRKGWDYIGVDVYDKKLLKFYKKTGFKNVSYYPYKKL